MGKNVSSSCRGPEFNSQYSCVFPNIQTYMYLHKHNVKNVSQQDLKACQMELMGSELSCQSSGHPKGLMFYCQSSGHPKGLLFYGLPFHLILDLGVGSESDLRSK